MVLAIRLRPVNWVRTYPSNYGQGNPFIAMFAAIKVGVPVVPGTPGPVEKYSDGDAFIKEYGFPGLLNSNFVGFHV